MSHVLVLTGPAARAVAAGLAPRWLGPDACEIAAGPGDLAAMRALVGAAPVDVNLVATAGRRRQVLVADMDGTIIEGECIDRLADLAGVGRQVAAITERAMAGELDFAAALRARVALLAGLDVSALDAVALPITPGARALVAAMPVSALVSGGFTHFTAKVAAELGFTHHRANVLGVRGGRLTGAVAEPILDGAAKAAALVALCADAGPGAALAVGDGANDLGMIRVAGLGVAFRARPAVEAQADAVIRHGDLSALLALQGIAAWGDHVRAS